MIKLNLSNNNGFSWYSKSRVKTKGYAFLKDKYFEKEELASFIESTFEESSFIETVSELNGSFVIIIIKKTNILLISDKLRSFPLFYFYNGSELKIYDHLNLEDKNLADDSSLININEFVHAACTIGDETILSNFKQIEPAQIISIDILQNKKDIIKYYEHHQDRKLLKSEREYYDKLITLSDRWVSRLIESLGGRFAIIPLSGGYDSRYILSALIKKNYKNIICYTYGKSSSFEIKTAKKVAESVNVKLIVIEYVEDKWKEIIKNKDFLNYLNFSFNFSSCPHIQDFLALFELREKNLLPKDGVIIPGYCGDLLGGSFLPMEINENKVSSLLARKVSEYIFKIQFRNVSCYLSEIEKNKIINKIEKKLDKSEDYTIDELIKQNEVFLTEHKVAKFVMNSLRAYEYFGFEWRTPLWDQELINFMYKIPNEKRINSQLYNDFLFDFYFIPLGIGFKKTKSIAQNKKIMFMRKIMPVNILTKAKLLYLFLLKKSKSRDVNNFQVLEDFFIEESGKNIKSNNINGALAYWMVMKIKKDRLEI